MHLSPVRKLKELYGISNLIKAPGLDGSHANFFQSQWDAVGRSVCDSIRNISESRRIPPGLGYTLRGAHS